MGFRTVVMLNNDRANGWMHDPGLGLKIAAASHGQHGGRDSRSMVSNYGRVVECVHADTTTLAVIDCIETFSVIGGGFWSRDQDKDAAHLALIRDAAARLGYNLTKKRAKPAAE